MRPPYRWDRQGLSRQERPPLRGVRLGNDHEAKDVQENPNVLWQAVFAPLIEHEEEQRRQEGRSDSQEGRRRTGGQVLRQVAHLRSRLMPRRYGRKQAITFQAGRRRVSFRGRKRIATGANRPPAGGAKFRDSKGRFSKEGRRLPGRQQTLF